MSKGKYASKRGKSSKSLALVLSLVLLITATVGGTLAWLTDTTGKVENTFTIGDINIDLTETGTDTSGTKNYLFVPGQELPKDPKVTVEAGSEDCYLFIKIKEANNPTFENSTDKIINWSVAEGWTMHKKETVDDANYYYYFRTYDKENDSPAGTAGYPILTGDQVTVSPAVTKDMVPGIKTNVPTLSFWAAAVQSENLTPDKANGQTEEAFAFSQIVWPNENP